MKQIALVNGKNAFVGKRNLKKECFMLTGLIRL